MTAAMRTPYALKPPDPQGRTAPRCHVLVPVAPRHRHRHHHALARQAAGSIPFQGASHPAVQGPIPGSKARCIPAPTRDLRYTQARHSSQTASALKTKDPGDPNHPAPPRESEAHIHLTRLFSSVVFPARGARPQMSPATPPCPQSSSSRRAASPGASTRTPPRY